MSEENEVTDDLSLALADAWDASEGENDGVNEPEGSSAVSEPDSESSGASEGSADSGSGTKPDVHEKWLRQGDEDADAVNNQSKEGEVNSLETPPAGISLEAREAWSEVPDAVKQDIIRREQDYGKGIEKHRRNAQRAEMMDRTLQPYQQLFAMNGGASQFMPNLLQTAAGLQMGTPAQKAQIAAKLIQDFGVDIKALDSALVGEAPPKEMQAQQQLDQYLNQKIQPLQQQLAQYQQRDQYAAQQAQSEVASEVQSFGSQNEFYNDVRADMADLLDLAANRGRELSMQQAYEMACNQHPTISKIMQQRASSQQVQQKRGAAASIHGSPGGSMQSAPNSMTAALNDAWDNAGRM